MEFLKTLGIKEKNFGASTGIKWYGSKGNKELKIFSPINGKYIASVFQANEKDYERVINKSHEAFIQWRKISYILS